MIKTLVHYRKRYHQSDRWLMTFKAREEKKRILEAPVVQERAVEDRNEVVVFAPRLAL